MLVLSRGTSDRISFPSLGISIEVLKLAGNRARIGIDAPKQIRVVRDELLSESDTQELELSRSNVAATSAAKHAYRNQLNRALLNLKLAGKLIEQGVVEEGLTSLSAGLAELCQLETDDLHASPPSTVTGTDRPADVRVLLVDDDKNERTLMTSYLRRCGIEVIEAADGLQALYSLANVALPDAVLLDMRMPNLDGPRTVNRIRSSTMYPDLPVFAVTGESAESAGVSLGPKGVNGWFRKPIDIDVVVATIKECAAERAGRV